MGSNGEEMKQDKAWAVLGNLRLGRPGPIE